jgi:hypothetical protein
MQYAYAYQLNGTQAGGLDPDARSYILAVEAADGQTLEAGVKNAYNTFVKGCKSDGIWDAIKASCIMAGARTLSGALVPLKGTAPTNFNFVSGDYNRETGLLGNGTTKYLDSNRNNNADPQNSKHIAAYRTEAPTGTPGGAGSGSLIGNLTNQTGASWLFDNVSPSADTIRVNSVVSIITLQYGSGATFVGASRSSGTSASYRFSGTTNSVLNASSAPSNENLILYRFTNYSSARIAFYSIGESIDLEKLDSRVTILMSNIATAIP